jgi:5,10-methylenetetrahydrofolate reductase
VSGLQAAIRSGKFVVTSELTPPKGTDLRDLFATAELLRNHVDALNITESPRARMALEPKSVAHLLLDRGIEPILQVTMRDRNRIAIQADLLGAAVLGIRNLVFMTGDAPQGGDHPDAKPVFDVHTLQLLNAARDLTRGRDMAGNELKGAPEFFLGGVANPGAPDVQAEAANARRKVDAGAQFLQTQAIYEPRRLEQFMQAAKLDGVAVLAGIIPLKSAKMARWLNEKVPGIRVPDALIAEIENVANPEEETRKGIEIAARLIREARGLCTGVHVMGLGWERHIPEILEGGGVQPAATRNNPR